MRAWTKTCLKCQGAKVGRRTYAPVGEFPAPDERFKHTHINITGPLLRCEAQSYLLTYVDRFSRWWEALPMPDITAYTTARIFLVRWVARYGVPERVPTHRGRQFESELFYKLSQLPIIKNIHSTSYHPKANGMVERLEGFTMCRVDQHQMVGTTTTDTPGTSHYGEEGVELFSCRSFVRNHTAVTGTILRHPPPKKVVDMTFFIDRLSSKMSEMGYSPSRKEQER